MKGELPYRNVRHREVDHELTGFFFGREYWMSFWINILRESGFDWESLITMPRDPPCPPFLRGGEQAAARHMCD